MKNDYRKLLNELQAHAVRDGVPLETVEQDYAISYVLSALSQIPELSEILLFRGGTALRKCYFKNYRYSKDLDYSVKGEIEIDRYNMLLESAAQLSESMLGEANGSNKFEVKVKLVKGRDDHNDQQDSHKFIVKFPWHLEQKSGRAGRTIKLDTSHSEPVVLATEQKTIIHPYSQPLATQVNCISLDEILAEKYVAMCAVAKQREQKERVSTRPRDYFDLNYALSKVTVHNKQDFLAAILIKSQRRGTDILTMKDLASHSSVSALERDWEPFLGDTVPKLIDCRTTLAELEAKIQKLFPDFASSVEAARARAEALMPKSLKS
jgi:predicted nucleotidyltransferase component of viral defense system